MIVNQKTRKRRWPAEWEEHAATWMAFPCRTEIWRHGKEKAQRAFAVVANLLSEYESVKMLVSSLDYSNAKKYLAGDIELITTDIDDSWTRDTAPIWVEQNNQIIAIDFKFNAWGNKFFPYENDQMIAKRIAEKTQSERVVFDMVLEGGSVHGNGNGQIMTTKECLLNSNRNPKLTQDDIEKTLESALGANKVIWLESGISGDQDTDGHIDNIACFIDQSTILTQSCGTDSENYEIYATNRRILKKHAFSLREIPEPAARYYQSTRVPLSYINFYLANDVVVVPQFGCKQDDAALAIICECFSERRVHGINANEILLGGGGIHCITMQQPLVLWPGNE